jgi:SAM-dependent methyltransferase
MENQSIQTRWETAHEERRFRPTYPHEQVVRWAFRDLERNARPKMKVLDLGCGAGRHSIFLANEGFDVSACDFSAAGLRWLGESARKSALAIPTHQTPAHDLSHYASNSFDAVLSFGVMYYLTLDEAEQMISEVSRVLRSGGKFFCVTRSDGDSRLLDATPLGRCAWHINSLEPGAPSAMEEDIDMLFVSKEDIERIFSPFTNLCVDRMTYTHEGFVNDDWIVTAAKP